MMIEYIRRAAVESYGATRGEIGWILDDNQGMLAIADAIDSKVNREYAIYAQGALSAGRPEGASYQGSLT